MQLALRGPRLDAERLADFFVRQAMNVVQDEHLARPLRQVRDPALQIDVDEALHFARLRSGERRLARDLAAAVHDDSRQPRAQRGAPRESRQRRHRPHPRFLHRILGIRFRSAREPQRHHHQRRRMRAKDRQEARFVALP